MAHVMQSMTRAQPEAKRVIGDGERGSVTAPLGVRDTSCSRLDFSVISLGFPRLLWNSFQVISRDF